jgi:hypothetical protein
VTSGKLKVSKTVGSEYQYVTLFEETGGARPNMV